MTVQDHEIAQWEKVRFKIEYEKNPEYVNCFVGDTSSYTNTSSK